MRYKDVFSFLTFLILSRFSPIRSAPKDVALAKELAMGGSQFSLSLMKDMVASLNESQPANVLISPVNIYQSLALVELGANGDTRQQLDTALGILSTDQVGLKKTHEELSIWFGDMLENNKCKLKMATGVFALPNFQMKDKFANELEKMYRCDLRKADFSKGGQEAADIVNKWVSEKTNGHIPQIFSGEAPKDILALLATALYFDAQWKTPFKPYKTEWSNFSTSTSCFQVETMSDTSFVRFVSNSSLQFNAIELPYTDDEFNMYILLPFPNQSIKNLSSHLAISSLSQISAAELTQVHYRIPKFKINSDIDLRALLGRMGVSKMFNSDAELGGMADGIKISQVKHKVELEVGEEGTKGSAVTTILAVPTSLDVFTPPPTEFIVDRPFLFYIQQAKTKAVIFSGAIMKPEPSQPLANNEACGKKD